jgi:hypothetical protein
MVIAEAAIVDRFQMKSMIVFLKVRTRIFSSAQRSTG